MVLKRRNRKEQAMFYAAIRKYSILPMFVEEVMRRIVGDFLPIISQAPDYLAYYALQVGNDEVITISIFYTLEGAQESNPLAFEWVQKNIAGFVQGVPEVTVGRVFAGSVGAKL
jgi:hypothetical protein